jgi:hypothetical protein
LAEFVAAEVFARTGREAPVDAHYVAKLERGVIRWPSAPYRAALAAVLGVEPGALGFRPPARPTQAPAGELSQPYPDDGLLALAARAEVTDIGPAAVEALEEVASCWPASTRRRSRTCCSRRCGGAPARWRPCSTVAPRSPSAAGC